MQPHILIVDDQEAIRLFLAATLDARGYRVSAAATGSEALAAVDEECPDLMLLDLRLPDMHGLDILEKTKDEHPDLCVVILTSFGKAEAAVEAMRRKAFDFVTKPVNLDHLLQVINRGLAAGESSRRRQRVDTVDDAHAPWLPFTRWSGRSPPAAARQY
jgi:DNA-binding NtrC family response regulator